MHNGMLEFVGDEMHKSIGNDRLPSRRLDRWGREATARLLPRRALAQADRLLGRDNASGGSTRGSLREVFRNPHEPAAADAWERFAAALEDDFNTPAALAVMHEWRDHELLHRALGVFGLESLAEDGRGADGGRRARKRRQAARGARDFDEADRLRDEIVQAGWEVRDEPGGYPARQLPVTRTSSTGAARCVSCSAGRARSTSSGRPSGPPPRPWLDAGPRVQVKPERELTEAAGTRDHQGVVAWCEPYRYADAYELAEAASGRCSCCLDQVTDPRNLGAVMPQRGGRRSDGRRRPGARLGSRHAGCLSGVGRSGRALPVAVVPNLARYLEEIKGPDLWVYAADRRDRSRCGRPTRGGVALVLGAEGKGVRPLVAAHVRRGRSPSRSPAASGSLNVSVAAAVLLYEAPARPASASALSRWPSRRCTSSTASTCCTRATSRTCESSSTRSRASSRCAARAASSSSTARRRSGESGRSSVRYAAHADDLLERLAAEHRGDELVCIVSSDDAVRRISGQEVREADLPAIPCRPASRPATESGSSADPEAASASGSTRSPRATGAAAQGREDVRTEF